MEYFDGDRSYIFELDDEKQVSQNTYEFCAPGIQPEKDNLQNLPYSIQEYALKIFKNKGHVCLENIESIEKSGIDTNKIITSQGIYSLILVPLWMGETLIGYMGVDNPKRNVSHADHLLALGDYIAAILLRRDNEAQILSDNRIMHDLMNDMPGGFVQMKIYPDGRVIPVFINEEFCRMSGMSHEQCMDYYGRDAYTGLHPDDQAMAHSVMEEMIKNRNTSTLRLRLTNGSGVYVPMQVFYRVTEDNAGNLYLSGYYTDLTEQIALEERKLAEHDQLTGLFNRTKLAHMVNGEYQMLTSCGVIFFDVNHLKEVNDTKGHDVGDVLLCIVADSIRSVMGRRIHGYRYGGDEFLVVVCDGKESELERLIELWRSRMEMLAKDRKVAATAAVGTAWSEAPFSLNDLIHKADKAMYADKHHNKR
ncbi:GGDEF domain-containing protein [Clostridium sp. chh4-2]|nr:GGDEF domain-containing protein [Clostridium sp. chh4-2]